MRRRWPPTWPGAPPLRSESHVLIRDVIMPGPGASRYGQPCGAVLYSGQAAAAKCHPASRVCQLSCVIRTPLAGQLKRGIPGERKLPAHGLCCCETYEGRGRSRILRIVIVDRFECECDHRHPSSGFERTVLGVAELRSREPSSVAALDLVRFLFFV